MIINPLHAIDFYKTDHRRQYPKGTTKVYANFTARSARLFKSEGFDDKVVFFGLQHFIEDFLQRTWSYGFFNKPKEFVVAQYKRRLDNALGAGAVPLEHIEELHDLGYLPLLIKALPEGTRVPVGVPMLTVTNTHPCGFWLVNYIESIMSAYLWKPCTAATIAYEYRRLLEDFAEMTGAPKSFVDFQAHDFSFRGMSGYHDAVLTGAGHMTSFVGTDNVAAIDFLEEFYKADSDKELIGCSVPATEHSVMCMGSKETEYDTYRRLITELYPTGFVSIVSDTWDYWKVLTETIPSLKAEIMARDGKVVVRPDSGDPVDIICGTRYGNTEAEVKGTVEILWDTFGGTINEDGYKVLDPHIGVIYGDSITLTRAEAILTGLKNKGFASNNIVLGIGSFTYEYVTRDTFGFAVKSTYGEIDGKGVDIFKDPVTDNGTKKSAVGLLRVDENLVLHEQQTAEEEKQGLLDQVFCDGVSTFRETLAEIRHRVRNGN